MDEDDSQDELINRSASQSKGKRPAVWDISDDSEDDEAESDEGESDSGEEEEEGEDNLDEDGEEEEEEEEDEEEEEEEDAQAEDGALGGTSADVAGLSSSDEDADKCPICLNSFTSQPVVTPESCEHYFCLDCILEWAKNANSCPVDRITFNNIYLRKCYGGKVKKVITVQKPVKEVVEEIVDLDLEQTSCEVCGGSDREDRLLLCDGCDAGYHMECLTPPLDSVPVEEWFCPECEVSNVQHSRVSAEEVSDTESLPSSARPATSRSQSRVPGPTRAIARTQHSERVRANVNRHRITQARTSQLAPTYMMQSTWLDDTINAVVAGLNTAVYVRNFTPRVPSTRRRKTRRRRKKTTSAKGKNGKVASTGVKRRKRRRTKSRRRMVMKKPITPRRRIANNLGIVKDKKSSSLPTVYRPAENTLSNMRADIGAASLSIYGDPFNLDPFVEHEEEQQQDRVTSLLEAKRRGISRSALRSHQPVARPVTASLSRRGMDVPQSGGVMEAAPVPDLLGSILSGQNMLLMDSSDVVINRDGTLKATKQMLPSALTPSCSNSSGDASADINPMMSPNQVDSCMSPPYSSDLPGSSRGSTNRPFSQSSSRLPSSSSSSSSSSLPSSQIPPSPHSDLAPRGPHSLQPPRPIRPPQPPGHRATNGFPTSSIHPTHPQSQPKKAAPAKPMWVDVSVLPRIPKIKRESGGIANDCTSPGGSIGSNRSRSNRGNSSDSTTSSNGYEMPELGMNSLAGDKGRQQSVDQQKGRTDGQRQRQSDGGAGSSTTTTTAFSNSFSSSSSSTGSPASHPRYPSSSSSSSAAVSFRINASWQSRRLSVGSSSATGESVQERWRKKEEEVKKRQLRRDKQMLLASHTAVDKEQESSTTIYDPFEPTNSESSSSDDEAKNTNPGASSLHATHERKAPSLENRQSKHDLIHVKTERQEIEVSQEQPTRASAQETPSQEARGSQEYVKVKKEKTETQTALLDTKVKKEPESDEADEAERFAHRLNSDTAHNTTPFYLNPDSIKKERDTTEEESGPRTSTSVSATSKNDSSSASNSASDKKKQKAVTKPDSKSCSKSPSRDGSHKKKSSQAPSTTPDNERGRRGERHASGQAGRQKDKQKEKERERSGRRSRSRERRKTRTASESSVSDSPDRTRRKRRPSRSPSKDRRRSRSGSSSGSREHSRKKKQKRSSKERNDGRERDTVRRPLSRDKRRARSRTKSVSKSRSRSRSKEQKRGRSRSRSLERRKKEPTHTRAQPSSLCPRDKMESRPKDKRIRRSRSSSRERRKGEVSSSSKSSEKTSKPSVSSRKDTKPLPDKKKDKGQTRSSVKEQKVASGTKAETKAEAHSCTVASKVKKESKDLGTDSQATTTEMVKEIKVEKEIKKEKRPSLDMFDMFEDPPFTEPMKKEEADTQSLADVKGIDELGTKEVTVQTETCVLIKTEPIDQTEPIDNIKTEPIDDIETEPSDITIMNSEQSSPKLCEEPPVTSCSTQTIPVKAESIQDDVSQSHPVSMASVEQPNTVVSTVHIKQELQQPSDSDDDFNVDVMLDNLDYVKSEPESTEETGASVKQEKEPEEEKTEGQILPIVGGAKSKTQVKRVTWNIQEPEGPQPEKSASKLALYKLKLKQEGARRPSSSVQTSSQDVTGAVSAVGPISSSSRSDGEGLSTSGEGETEERTNQQYLKKLHMQERAVEEVKLAIKPFYQKRDIDKDEYKEILRKAVQKVCHSKSGEINPVKVGNLVKAYVDKYRHARKYKKGEDSEGQTESMNISDSP